MEEYRQGKSLSKRDWRDAQAGNPPGEKPAELPAAGTLQKTGEAPDVSGMGEGEVFVGGQRGEMPKDAKKASPKAGFVEAAKPVKSDVPANR